MDRAGWHTTGSLDMPRNITPIFLPSRAPELNPVENIWQYMRANYYIRRETMSDSVLKRDREKFWA
jgi:transposase